MNNHEGLETGSGSVRNVWRLLNSASRSASKQRVMVGYLARIALAPSSEPSVSHSYAPPALARP